MDYPTNTEIVYPPTDQQGVNGATWHTGTGVPSNLLGSNADLYLDENTGNIYLKASGAYTLIANITGPAGGTTWRSGSGVPSNGTGVNGDFYFRTATSDIYVRASGTYSIIANIKGATGSTGSTGPPGSLLTGLPIVNVTLGGTAFDIVASVSSVPAGISQWNITSPNSLHELLVVNTSTASRLTDGVANAWTGQNAAAFIAAASTGVSLDESGMDIRLDSDNMPMGTSLTRYPYLPEGSYVLLCNEAGHAHLGMAIDFTVAG